MADCVRNVQPKPHQSYGDSDNYRPVQRLNGRTFLEASAPLAAAPAPTQLPMTGGQPVNFAALLGGGLVLLGLGVYLWRRVT